MRFWIPFSALIAAFAFGGLWLHMENTSPESSISPSSEGRIGNQLPIANAPASSTPLAAVDSTSGAVVPRNTPTNGPAIASKFRNRSNLRTLAHEALISKDPVQLYYSKLYLGRCISASGTENVIKGNTSAPSQISPSVLEASQQFSEFCGPFLANPDEYRKSEFYALSRAPDFLNSSRAQLKDRQGLASAAASRDAEWFIETFLAMDAREKFNIFTPPISERSSQRGLGLFLAMTDAAAMLEACSRWGCDIGYRMTSNCLIEQRACKADGLEAQFVEMLSPDSKSKVQIEADIQKMRERIGEWIDSL